MGGATCMRRRAGRATELEAVVAHDHCRRYMGLKQPRLRGDAYYEVIDEFVTAVMGRWPKAVLQVRRA